MFTDKSPVSSKLDNIQEFEGLRGIAIVCVLIIHTLEHYIGQFKWQIIYQLAVPLFFCISGFCITFGIFKRSAEGRNTTAMDFTFRRFYRIYPPYILAVLLYLVKYLLVPNPARQLSDLPSILFYNITLTQLFTENWTQLNPAFWSLCVEMQFYVFIALCLVLLGRGWKKTTSCFISLVFLVSVFMTFWQRANGSIPEWTWFMAFPRYAPLFFMGASMAWYRVHQRRGEPVSVCQSLMLVIIFLAAVGLVSWGWLISFLIILAGISSRLKLLQNLKSLLCWRPLMFLGDRSYSIYLVHGLGVAFLSQHGAALLNKNVFLAYGVLLFTWVYCITSGAIYYQLIERRFLSRPKS